MTEALATVVIPCLNSAAFLDEALRALNAQRVRRRLRVVVVDNESTDGSRDVAKRLADDCLVVTETRGPSYPRNAGLEVVETAFMLTIDADCVPVDETWAERHLDAISAAPDTVIGTASAILPHPRGDLWSRRKDVTPQPHLIDGRPVYAAGGNSCYRTDLVRRLGGFPPFAADDAAFGALALAEGLEFLWVPDALVYHHNPEGWRGYYRQMRKVGFYAAELEERPPVLGRYLAGQARHAASSAKPLLRGDVREALARATRATAQTQGALAARRARGRHRRTEARREDLPTVHEAPCTLDVTIAICTRDRPSELRRCLASIARSTWRVHEVLVSDDGSDPATDVVVGEFEQALRRLRLLTGPRRGLAANRNRCIDAATGDYVLFLDDDAWLGEDFLEHVRLHAGPDRIVSGYERRKDELVRPSNPNFLGFLQAPPNGDLKSIVINATLFPTDFLRRTYFDEFLRYGSEETEIAFAARAAGLHVIQAHAVNHHEHSPLGREAYPLEAARARAYLSARRYLQYERRPTLYVAYVASALANAGLHALRTAGPRAAVRTVGAVADGVLNGGRTRARRLNPSPLEMAVRVSVVVPTWRRAVQLERCLVGLSGLRRRPDEVIVVRREEDLDAAQVVAVAPSLLQVCEVVVSEGGQVAALEAGAHAATGDIVAFLDDDVVPRTGWLDFLLEAYADPEVGAVGGRDVVHPSYDREKPQRIVGRVRRFGRVVGNHHLGTGGAREVDVLKGANASFRRELVSFPHGLRGRGAQVANDLAMSLAVRRAGWKVVYDPRAEVDHYPGPRHDVDRRGAPTTEALADGVFNRCYVLGSLRPRIRLARLVYGTVVGDRSMPGLARAALALLRGERAPRALRTSLVAQLEASRRARIAPLVMAPIEPVQAGGDR